MPLTDKQTMQHSNGATRIFEANFLAAAEALPNDMDAAKPTTV